VKLQLKSPHLFNFSLPLGEKKLGIFMGSFSLSAQDRETLTKTATLIWQKVIKKTRMNNFIGHIRFDFIPGFNREIIEIENGVFELGPLQIVGIYEINVHSPECLAAVTVFREITKRNEFNPTVLLAREIKRIFNNEKIVFVVGRGLVKRAWKEIYLRELRQYLEIIPMEEEEVMMTSKPSIIWRWGDARIEGPSEYSSRFQEWLREYPGIVFNTLPQQKEQDLGNKMLLLPENGEREWNRLVGENRWLNSEEVLEWGIENQSQLVLKPLLGSSGKDITFGKNISQKEWTELLKKVYSSSCYGLYEARWLPKISINSYEDFTFDVNSAFWAEGEKLVYLYTVVRVDSWERYWQRGTINVTQGAGFAGCCLEEE
jgi:hypothetical protein